MAACCCRCSSSQAAVVAAAELAAARRLLLQLSWLLLWLLPDMLPYASKASPPCTSSAHAPILASSSWPWKLDAAALAAPLLAAAASLAVALLAAGVANPASPAALRQQRVCCLHLIRACPHPCAELLDACAHAGGVSQQHVCCCHHTVVQLLDLLSTTPDRAARNSGSRGGVSATSFVCWDSLRRGWGGSHRPPPLIPLAIQADTPHQHNA